MEKLRADKMDEKGYTFTPLTVLLFVPIMIVAISYGNIVNEANMLANLAMGGDVTITISASINSNIEKGALDGGRNAAYNATRLVIDNSSVNTTASPFFGNGDSKAYVKNRIINALNTQVINASRQLESETGRQIFINNIPINNYTNSTFGSSDVNITQNDPFGFYVTVRGGIPIKVIQNNQSYEGFTTAKSVYVSIEGLEDPYIWINSKFRQSNVIYQYPFYTNYLGNGTYYMQQTVNNTNKKIYNFYDCLNGTNNPSNITPRPNYIVNPNGLSFFDRLENRSSSADPNNTRMSTFILGAVLLEDHNNVRMSILDREYFSSVIGYPIVINGTNMVDPTGSPVYLSNATKSLLGITL